jgi:hypothetical protein
MLFPGLMVWGSAIQAASDPRVVGSMPAAIVCRSPTWVRSGPSVPAALVPRTVWQAEQALLSSTVRPASCSGVPGRVASASCASRQRSKSSGVSTTISSAI